MGERRFGYTLKRDLRRPGRRLPPLCPHRAGGGVRPCGRGRPQLAAAAPHDPGRTSAGGHERLPRRGALRSDHACQVSADAPAGSRRAPRRVARLPVREPLRLRSATRYNASGEKPNNDFLRYELAPGVWRGELRTGEKFLRWVPYDGGPQETRALQRELAGWPAPAAALDIHQGSLSRRDAGLRLHLRRFRSVPAVDRRLGRLCPRGDQHQVDEYARTDADGLIPLNDGSVTDYFHRLGVEWTACLETDDFDVERGLDAINLMESAGSCGWRRAFRGEPPPPVAGWPGARPRSMRTRGAAASPSAWRRGRPPCVRAVPSASRRAPRVPRRPRCRRATRLAPGEAGQLHDARQPGARRRSCTLRPSRAAS